MNELHIGHLGIDHMKALVRRYSYWKNIDKDIEILIKNSQQSIERMLFDFAESNLGNTLLF